VTVPGAPSDAGDPAITVQRPPWQVHAASAIGAGHVKDGRPNQDAVGWKLASRPDGSTVLVIAVADGHGDTRHFRSERGAEMAVSAGISAVLAWSAQISAAPAVVQGSAQRALVPDVVARWDAAVAADLARNPFTDAERVLHADAAQQSGGGRGARGREEQSGGGRGARGREEQSGGGRGARGRDKQSEIAYGSTLLLATLTADCAVFAQIGDGNIVAVLPEGGFLSPVQEDNRLDGWRTTSLCQADAADAFRVGVISLAASPLFAVLVATDGFGNAQADDPWQPGVAADLVRLAVRHGVGWFASQVPGWAAQCASSEGSGDDSTLALAINSAVAPAHRERRPGHRPQPAAVAGPARTLELVPPPDDQTTAGYLAEEDLSPAGAGGGGGGWQRTGVSRTVVWVVVAAAVLLGLAFALLLRGHGQHRPTPTPLPAHSSSQHPARSPRPSPAPSPSASPGASASPTSSATRGPSPGAHSSATHHPHRRTTAVKAGRQFGPAPSAARRVSWMRFWP
jgi:Protein phosphatase 2C